MLLGSMSAKAVHRTLMKLTHAVNFINTLMCSFCERKYSTSVAHPSLQCTQLKVAFNFYNERSITGVGNYFRPRATSFLY